MTANRHALQSELFPTRATATVTTGSLPAGQPHTGTIEVSRAYRLLRLTTDVPARVRVYSSSANRDSDIGRAASVDPGQGTGVLLDYLTVDGFLGGDLSPLVDGAVMDSPETDEVPITIIPTSAGPVTVTLVFLRTE